MNPALERSPEGDAPPRVVRLTVALLASIAHLLSAIVDRTGMSKTDVINRAIKLYAFIDEETADGSELVIRRKNGEERIVQIL